MESILVFPTHVGVDLFAILKKEWTTNRIYPCHAALDNDRFVFIELHYKRKRLYSALDDRSPADCERAFLAASNNLLASKENASSTSCQEAVAV